MMELFAASCVAIAYYLTKPLPKFELPKFKLHSSKKHRSTNSNFESTREVIEILTLCLSSGMTIPAAVSTVTTESDTQLATQLGIAFQNHQLGANLGEELGHIATQDQYWKFLVRLLQQSWHQGATILENLTELNDYLLELERATILRKVKRAGVMSVLPLGFCFLPAFGLVVVLPLVASLMNFN